MERLTDLTHYTWINEETSLITPGNSITVAHCIPHRFAAYCKILHPIYADPSVQDKTETWADLLDEAARHGTTITVELGSPSTEHRIRWRDLLPQLGRDFHPNVTAYTLSRAFKEQGWPRYLIGPHEGTLDELSCTRFVELLRPFTGHQDCFFHYVIYATSTRESDLLYRGKLHEAIQTLTWDEPVTGSPTYWWPEDKQWCLCTDYDLTFTLVGGSEALIHALLADEFLESVPVSTTSPVDDAGDTINQ